MRWKVYYTNGSEFGSKEGFPEDAPGSGVLAVAQENETVGVETLYQCDFYCFDEKFGGWVGMDKFGLAQYLSKPGFKIIKMGEVMNTTLYRAMIARIKDDPALPDKSAKYPWEIVP